MTLQASGPISFSDIAVELALASNTAIAINDPLPRQLAGVASGAISLNNFYGKTYEVFTVYTAPIVDYAGEYYPGDKILGQSWWPAAKTFNPLSPNGAFKTYNIVRIGEIHGLAGTNTAVRRDLFEFSFWSALSDPVAPANPIATNYFKRIEIYNGTTLVRTFQASAAVWYNWTEGYSTRHTWGWTLPTAFFLVTGVTYTIRVYH